MRSVLIVAEWINLDGGVTRTLLELLRRMDPDEYDVTLLVLRPAQSSLAAVPAHVKVVVSDYPLPYLGTRGVAQHLLARRRMFQLGKFLVAVCVRRITGHRARFVRFFVRRHPLPRGQFDVAISYAMLDSYSNQYVAHRVVAVRKVMWCHIDSALYDARELNNLVPTFECFDAINCVAADAKRSLGDRLPSIAGRLRVRHNFMDETGIRRLGTEPLPVPRPSIPALATVGRITPEKGTDLLLDVAGQLRDDGYRFVWWVIGPDFNEEFAAKVKMDCAAAELGSYVIFIGSQPNPYPFIAQCDIYVQPSRIEGFSTSIAEAKILLKPVITTAVSGANEQFESGVTGSIVPVTADALYAEIKRMLDDPSVGQGYETALLSRAKTPSLNVASYL